MGLAWTCPPPHDEDGSPPFSDVLHERMLFILPQSPGFLERVSLFVCAAFQSLSVPTTAFRVSHVRCDSTATSTSRFPQSQSRCHPTQLIRPNLVLVSNTLRVPAPLYLAIFSGSSPPFRQPFADPPVVWLFPLTTLILLRLQVPVIKHPHFLVFFSSLR